MAKITSEIKEKILADFHTGKFSQRELAKKYAVSNGSVANLLKGLTPKNEHLVEAQIALLSAQAQKSEIEMSSILSTAKDEAYNRGLIFNATQKNLTRVMDMLNKNTKYEKVGVGDGVQTFEPVELNANDYKALQDAIDKASLTLGVNQRTANTTINNANVQQSEETKIVIERRDLADVDKG
nr:MAG TPA: helix-turn-helix, Psq domain [Caudoviricetes sp.]